MPGAPAVNDRTLIVASAGSGKTHTLTSHLARLIQAGVPPEQLSALTFSRAAAGEIYMELIARLLDKGDVKALRHLVAVQ
ncbi:MAG: UvrD-helicase domain-containing protein, partial [Kiritimatiellae bacterium]|nr:UvrD-helicase domain-containing protein [Kiritimatiellia bacterium]